jgi:hypothetical protein
MQTAQTLTVLLNATVFPVTQAMDSTVPVSSINIFSDLLQIQFGFLISTM